LSIGELDLVDTGREVLPGISREWWKIFALERKTRKVDTTRRGFACANSN
jgi:hypothetical protein